MVARDDPAGPAGQVSDRFPQARRDALQDLRALQMALKSPNREVQRMQRALDAAQARYIDFYDLAPVGFLCLNNALVILEANLTTAALLGLPRNGLVGRVVTDFMFEPDAASCQQLCQRVLAGGGTQSGELRLRQPDGQAVWVKLRAMAATGNEGAVVIRLVLSDISERKQAEATLMASTRLRDAILDSVPSQIAVLDYAGVILAVNDGWRRVALDNCPTPDVGTGFNPIGINYLDICQAAEGDDEREQATRVHDGILRVINGTAPSFYLEYTCNAPAQQLWFLLVVTPLHIGNHAVVVTHNNITQRRQLEQAAKQASEDKFKLVADNVFDGIVIFDAKRQIEYVSPSYAEQLGYSDVEELKQSSDMLFSLVHPEDQDLLFARIHRAVESKDVNQLYSYRVKHRLGHYLWRESSVKFQYDGSGRLVRTCVVARDVTQRIAADEVSRRRAYFDPLTGLPNRALLVDRLYQVLTTSARTGNFASLLYVDMDNFKRLKHTLGHDIGNLMLKQVAQRLTGCVQVGDTVARLGGDEFMVLLAHVGKTGLEAAKQAEAVAGNILATLSQPYQLGKLSHHCTASLGATLCQGQNVSVDDLLKQVDLAMYHAKAAGQNVLRFFDTDMDLGVQQRIALEKDLRHAVAANQFVLHYQAQVESAGRVMGAEVLVRWQHPQRGMVAPANFIALAEETGLILALGHWVLETACAQLKVWGDRPGLAHLTMAVNVSALQFAQTDFVDQVLRTVQRSGANPLRLKLELTESLLVGNVDDIVRKMNVLKASGIGFSLDDFGTGFSSLAYLSRLPLDQLKIDRSFVDHVLTSPDDAAIARTIIALARSLNLGVIAEGVETEAQRTFLAGAGCHAYQGYLFSRPLSLPDFEAFADMSGNLQQAV